MAPQQQLAFEPMSFRLTFTVFIVTGGGQRFRQRTEDVIEVTSFYAGLGQQTKIIRAPQFVPVARYAARPSWICAIPSSLRPCSAIAEPRSILVLLTIRPGPL